MIESVLIELGSAGATYERFEVPGSFELPGASGWLIESYHYPTDRKEFDGYIALGCVIRGETSHYDYVCEESARGLNDLVLKYAIALGYGVLTTETGNRPWRGPAGSSMIVVELPPALVSR